MGWRDPPNLPRARGTPPGAQEDEELDTRRRELGGPAGLVQAAEAGGRPGPAPLICVLAPAASL